MGIFIACIVIYILSALFTGALLRIEYGTPMGSKWGQIESIHQTNCLVWTPVLNTITLVTYIFKSPFNDEYRRDVKLYRICHKGVKNNWNFSQWSSSWEYFEFIQKYRGKPLRDTITKGDAQVAIEAFDNKYYKKY
jgi:hypothetical protein